MASTPPVLSNLYRCTALLLAVSTVLSACSRGVYRRQADREVYGLTGARAKQVGVNSDGWKLDRGTDSRLHDPANLDEPPMPIADDPEASKLSHRSGKTAQLPEEDVEPWLHYLPKGSDGAVTLDIRGAVHVAARNSRDFQRAREELFLSALDLTEDRYQFRPKLALGTTGTGTGEGATRARTVDGG